MRRFVWLACVSAVAVVVSVHGAPPIAEVPVGPLAQDLPTVTPTVGMVIDHSVRFAPGTYRLSVSESGEAISVRGDGVTLDLTGVMLEGGEPEADPDGYVGTGIKVGGDHVTIRGGAVRGYKVALRAQVANYLHVTGGDYSYNWKPRLWSGIERESLLDWLTYHHNERDEWLRYGAAIYLADCADAEIDNTRAVQNQNGLLAVRSTRLRIWNNTFSWNSGLGIGFYRTTDSLVRSNRLDYDVRGYSHGFYNRGQDSAAFLIFEQSSHNTVYKNSMTHGGDGVFLWAGQSTMDSGQGGANDNLFEDNDVSHAVANGIEATFSRNEFVGNRIEDCWHGIWGGYSFDSEIVDNTFTRNTDGIAVEHGQHVVIDGNHFEGDETAIRLWANPTQDPTWGYAKARDTRSHDYRIARNMFSHEKTALNLIRTSDVVTRQNEYADVPTPLQLGPGVASLRFETDEPQQKVNAGRLREWLALPGEIDAKLPPGARRGRDTIIVDEWGPYDYLSPKIWPAGKPGDRPLKLRVLGPAGKWTLESIRGGTASATSGDVPSEIVITQPDDGSDLQLDLDYVGAAVTTPRGAHFSAGAHVPFHYSRLDPAIDWAVKYWSFDDASDPVKAPSAFAARLTGAPIKTATMTHLDLLTGGLIAPDLPRSNVAMRAEGVVNLPAGDYQLTTISDDGIRVWIDDAPVIDRWTVHESALDHAPLTGGRHRLRIDYFQATGWAELQLRFWRAAEAPVR